MKQIENYVAKKYEDGNYKKIDEGIYEMENQSGEVLFVTSLSFIQEPDYGEGDNASLISQYPLEDILDKYYCHISDFYDELNTEDSYICYQEFASLDIENIRNLRSIIGKHVYNEEDGETIKLVIE